MIIWFLVYLPLHFLAYVLVVRHLAWFRREAGIFMYHAVPAAGAGAWALGLLIAGPGSETLYQAVLVISLQGIYSLSFLELWSLAQGGYSLTILSRLDSGAEAVRASALASLEQVGAGKQAGRLAGLLRLRLIKADGDRFRLTRRGRTAAAFLRSISWAANHKQLG